MEDEKIIELYWQRSPQAIDETSRKYGAYCMRLSMNILTVSYTHLRAHET